MDEGGDVGQRGRWRRKGFVETSEQLQKRMLPYLASNKKEEKGSCQRNLGTEGRKKKPDKYLAGSTVSSTKTKRGRPC